MIVQRQIVAISKGYLLLLLTWEAQSVVTRMNMKQSRMTPVKPVVMEAIQRLRPIQSSDNLWSANQYSDHKYSSVEHSTHDDNDDDSLFSLAVQFEQYGESSPWDTDIYNIHDEHEHMVNNDYEDDDLFEDEQLSGSMDPRERRANLSPNTEAMVTVNHKIHRIGPVVESTLSGTQTISSKIVGAVRGSMKKSELLTKFQICVESRQMQIQRHKDMLSQLGCNEQSFVSLMLDGPIDYDVQFLIDSLELLQCSLKSVDSNDDNGEQKQEKNELKYELLDMASGLSVRLARFRAESATNVDGDNELSGSQSWSNLLELANQMYEKTLDTTIDNRIIGDEPAERSQHLMTAFHQIRSILLEVIQGLKAMKSSAVSPIDGVTPARLCQRTKFHADSLTMAVDNMKHDNQERFVKGASYMKKLFDMLWSGDFKKPAVLGGGLLGGTAVSKIVSLLMGMLEDQSYRHKD